jgi:hypothetical protein
MGITAVTILVMDIVDSQLTAYGWSLSQRVIATLAAGILTSVGGYTMAKRMGHLRQSPEGRGPKLRAYRLVGLIMLTASLGFLLTYALSGIGLLAALSALTAATAALLIVVGQLRRR